MKKVLIAVLLAAAGSAHAQPADTAALTKLIETQPPDMDRSTWKEKRRDAARKLVQSKDKKAVPELIHLVETENFDIIGEIAIEGLGNMGDASAIPALQKAANDASRDKQTRDLAKKALAKLGADAKVTNVPPPPPPPPPPDNKVVTPPPPPPDNTPPTPTPTPTPTPDASALIGEQKAPEGLPPEPALPDDAIAAYDRLTFAAGTASLAYDTVRKRASFDADVAGRWQKRVERETMAYGWDTGAHLVTGMINPEGRESNRGAQLGLDGSAEARFYSGKIYGIGKAAVGFQLNYISNVDGDNPDNDFKDTRYTADIQAAIGGGYGRLIDAGAAIRVRRLARTLDAARALGKQIDAATSRKLQMAWWSLRGERSMYRALVVTVQILREAGILLGEPDAGLSFEILNVLRDSQLFLRPDGVDLQLVVSEGYLVRDDMDPTPTESGRVEQAIVSAGYGKQLNDDKTEVSGTGFARLRILAPDDQPSPWALGATGRLRQFTYGEHGDPFGALDLSATVLLSKDGAPMGQMAANAALRIEGSAGFTYWMNQASGLRAAANIAEDSGEVFFGASLEATYGLLDGSFAR